MSTPISEDAEVREALDAALTPDLADHVLQLIDAAASGTDATAPVVILRGGPGVGKTRILDAINRAISTRHVDTTPDECDPVLAPLASAPSAVIMDDFKPPRSQPVNLAAGGRLAAEARVQVQYFSGIFATGAALRSVPDGKLLLLDDATPEQVNALAGRQGGMVIATLIAMGSAMEVTDGLSDAVLRRSRQFNLHPQPAAAAAA